MLHASLTSFDEWEGGTAGTTGHLKRNSESTKGSKRFDVISLPIQVRESVTRSSGHIEFEISFS